MQDLCGSIPDLHEYCWLPKSIGDTTSTCSDQSMYQVEEMNLKTQRVAVRKEIWGNTLNPAVPLGQKFLYLEACNLDFLESTPMFSLYLHGRQTVIWGLPPVLQASLRCFLTCDCVLGDVKARFDSHSLWHAGKSAAPKQSSLQVQISRT